MVDEIESLFRRFWLEQTGHEAPRVGDRLKFRAGHLGDRVVEGVVKWFSVSWDNLRRDENCYWIGVDLGERHGCNVVASTAVYDDTSPLLSWAEYQELYRERHSHRPAGPTVSSLTLVNTDTFD